MVIGACMPYGARRRGRRPERSAPQSSASPPSLVSSSRGPHQGRRRGYSRRRRPQRGPARSATCSRTLRRLYGATSSAPPALVFTWWDMENHPHHCAAELALGRYPVDRATVHNHATSMTIGMANDLLLGLAPATNAVAWQERHAGPHEGFVVPACPRATPPWWKSSSRSARHGVEVMMADPGAMPPRSVSLRLC